MCGIAIQYSNNYINPDKIHHRGKGFWGKIHCGMYTGYHIRLPLQTDLGDSYQQPIRLHWGGYLLYNGEIFNVPGGYPNDVSFLTDFFSNRDWKERLKNGGANTWDGFWAICIITEEEVFAFTDPLGKKQLYYKDGCISSEIKPLLNREFKEEEFDMSKVERTDLTPFRGVKRIIPNRLYRFTGYTTAISGFDGLVDLKSLLTDEGLPSLLRKSVSGRTINRLDINTVFVSGGLDSTIILRNLMETDCWRSLDLISIENDESEYVDIVEEWAGKEIRRIALPKIPDLKDILYKYESPIDLGSLVPQFELCKNSWGSVIYTGDGADELFSGYSRAQKGDTFKYDVFMELPYYHNIRLDRAGMAFTKEIRCPFMSHDLVRLAYNTPWKQRRGKQQLKRAYKNEIPQQIIEREKTPLRVEEMKKDRDLYKRQVLDTFNHIKFHL